MRSTVIERLRDVTGFIRFETGDRVRASACIADEAADLIEALQAERDSAWDDALEAAAEVTENLPEWHFSPPWKRIDHAAAIRAMKKDATQ